MVHMGTDEVQVFMGQAIPPPTKLVNALGCGFLTELEEGEAVGVTRNKFFIASLCEIVSWRLFPWNSVLDPSYSKRRHDIALIFNHRLEQLDFLPLPIVGVVAVQ